MKNVRVQNMVNGAGRTIPNQFEIFTDDGVYFQSYSTTIAFKPYRGKVQLDSNAWDYSRTTAKYRNLFLNEGKADTVKKIKDGTYELTNLN